MKGTLKILMMVIMGICCLYSCGHQDIPYKDDSGVIKTNCEIKIVSGTIPAITTVTQYDGGKSGKTTQNSNSEETSTTFTTTVICAMSTSTATASASSAIASTSSAIASTSAATAQPEITQDDSQSDTNESCQSNSHHKVQLGESWSSIANLYNVDLYQLAAANGRTIDDVLLAGESIIIPTGEIEYAQPISTKNVQQNEDLYSGQFLGSGTVYSAPDKYSWTNISQAIADINGLTLAPGKYFYWNDYIGWKTAQDVDPSTKVNSWGYVEAPVIGGTAPGGGICVVSTTLNKAARAAGMSNIYNEPHSLPVTYASGDDEAAVDYGCKDLWFSNPYSYSVVFYATCEYGVVTISCYVA